MAAKNVPTPQKTTYAQTPPPLPVKTGDLIKDQYEIICKLGKGGFGAVFKVKDRKSKKDLACKFELQKPKSEEPGLELEISVIKLLQFSSHFLRFYDSGKLKDCDYVVMQLAGRSLSDLRKACPKKCFTDVTTFRLVEQCLDAVEVMHAIGILHRDIKPANFTIGCTGRDSKNIYLLDFGLVRQFKMRDGTLRAPRARTGFRGMLNPGKPATSLSVTNP